MESCDNRNLAEQAVDDFPCLLCDFTSNWASGLEIHMTRKHGYIQQIDGDANEDIEEGLKYEETSHSWKNGKLGTIYQTFLDVNAIIDGSNLSEESKVKEKAKALESRKCAFGTEFHRVPPWKVWR